ncbi:MAG: putative acyl-CoA synthetase [Acidimicrobiales bacterium]|nr:putative acyl-CoA synthetase [Acidimicrobiales bacterium]
MLLHELLEAAARRTPRQVAIVDGERECSYEELDATANRLANGLIGRGVEPGDRVGLHLKKSVDAVAAIYATLKAGAVYVPLDPDAPAARVATVVDDGAIAHVVDADLVDRLDRGPTDAPVVERRPDDLAYLLYTSGSTGRPKGVMLSHRNGTAFVEWAGREYRVGADDRLSSHAPLHFDLSIFDLFAAAAAGATLVLVPRQASMFPVELASFIERRGITVWYSVPSVLNALVRRGALARGALPELRLVMFAGEVFPTAPLRALMAAVPHARFANLYGPTETNVCTAGDVPALRRDDDVVPIGRPITGVEVVAVTDDGGLAGRGEVGELLVRGPTVAAGYWGDAAGTAARWVEFPPGAGGDRWYRTGDLARTRADGAFEFAGRRDDQVKSRGYRIELGDVEHALQAHPLVAESAVVAVPDELLTNRLKAFVVATSPVTVHELLTDLATRLPRAMVPTEVELRSALPRTATGKIDRQQLLKEATNP